MTGKGVMQQKCIEQQLKNKNCRRWANEMMSPLSELDLELLLMQPYDHQVFKAVIGKTIKETAMKELWKDVQSKSSLQLF